MYSNQIRYQNVEKCTFTEWFPIYQINNTKYQIYLYQEGHVCTFLAVLQQQLPIEP